jgi:50S ribosomal protein L4, bacterial/organelle
MEVPVYSMKGQQVGTMPIDEVALGETINAALIKQAYVMYHANLRVGTSKTLKRADVAFSKKKIYKQKGTGRARHGDKKAPNFRKGGHAHHKQREAADYKLDMPKKMRRKANRNALLAKLMDNEVKVIDSLAMAKPRTADMTAFLSAIGVNGTALLALSPDADKSQAVRLSARNVDGVSICRVDQLNCFEMLNKRYLIVGRAELESWLTGPSSQTGKDAKVSPMGRSNGGAE